MSGHRQPTQRELLLSKLAALRAQRDAYEHDPYLTRRYMVEKVQQYEAAILETQRAIKALEEAGQ